MPRLSAQELVDAVTDAFLASGASSVVPPRNLSSKPWSFTVIADSRVAKYAVFIWTITHGGGPRDPDEYRIQMTGVQSPLSAPVDQEPLLLGFYEEEQLLAGFNFDAHRVFGASPSIQLLRSALVQAKDSGLSVSEKTNGEKAFGIRPDHLLIYAARHRELHEVAGEPRVKELLAAPVAKERSALLAEVAALGIPEPRKKVLREALMWSRDEKFRKLVACAYGNRCAISKLQMRLVDAAHVLPVSDARSTDLITNGILLSPTFHRAYDTNLIYLEYDRDSLVMKVNEKLVAIYSSAGLDGNVEMIRAALGSPLHLPADHAKWPSPDMVRHAKQRLPASP